MGRMQRQKGKAGEREAAAVLALHWGALNARRSVQFCGKAGDADLTGIPGMHLEVKRYAGIAALRFGEQAQRDAAPGAVPVVVMREDGNTQWWAMVPVEDCPAFARALLGVLGERAAPEAECQPSEGLE